MRVDQGKKSYMNMIMKVHGWVLPFGCVLALVTGAPCSGQADVPADRPPQAMHASALTGIALDRCAPAQKA